MTGLAADEEQQVESDHDTNLDVQSLMDRILRLKTLLKEANRRSENPVQLDDFLCDESSGQWKEMFMRLKEEVERQKNVAGVLQVWPLSQFFLGFLSVKNHCLIC